MVPRLADWWLLGRREQTNDTKRRYGVVNMYCICNENEGAIRAMMAQSDLTYTEAKRLFHKRECDDES